MAHKEEEASAISEERSANDNEFAVVAALLVFTVLLFVSDDVL
jgi:hypothetical protein